MSHWIKRGCLTIAALALVLSHAEQAKAGVVYSQNFDAGSAPEFNLGGLWHVTSNFPSSGSYALGYVQGETSNSSTDNGNYNTGSKNSGIAWTSAINLPIGEITLSFNSFNHNEYGNSPNYYDRLTVGVSNDGINFAKLVASSYTNDNVVNIPHWTPSNLGYTPITVNLSSFAGKTIYLGFKYDTVDSTDNNHSGARIDDLVISAHSAAAPEPASMSLLAVGIVGLAGYRLRKRKSEEVAVA